MHHVHKHVARHCSSFGRLLEETREREFATSVDFGDMTFWSILDSCMVLPDILTYLCVTHLRLWSHMLSVAPERHHGGQEETPGVPTPTPNVLPPDLCANWESRALLSSRGFCGKT